jgi:quercetin dioxygenase-like cupin family protein
MSERPAALTLSRDDLFATELPRLPGAATTGFDRAAYRGLGTTFFQTNAVVLPVDQRSTARASEVDHVIVVLEGGLVVSVDGTEYSVGPWDQIFVPANVDWHYRNAHPSTTTFLSIVSDPV